MERLTSTSLRDVLDKVAPAIEAGSVNIISVEAIRERSASRWSRKREQVESFVLRAFSRQSQAGDLIVALNDAEFLTIQPNLSRSAALGASATLLRETLAFFLGAASPDDLHLLRVTGFRGGALEVEAVDPNAAFAASDSDPDQNQPSAALPGLLGTESPSFSRPAKFRLTAGPRIAELTVSSEAVWNVRSRAVASFQLQPAVSLVEPGQEVRPASVSELTPNMAAEVFLAALRFGLAAAASQGAPAAFHVGVPLAALTYSTSRYRILQALNKLEAPVRRLIVLELEQLPEGFTAGRLTELVSMVAPYARAVLARAPSEFSDVAAWRSCGLNGVSLDASHIDPDDRRGPGRLAGFAARAADVTRECVAYGLSSRSLLLAAWSAGFTHLAGSEIRSAVQGATAVRMPPEQVFCRDLGAA